MRNKTCALLEIALGVFGIAGAARAEDITIHLPQNASISGKTVQYQCDTEAGKMGLPSSSFAVEYISGGSNRLAIVPIDGNPVVFSNVISASGARYAAQHYIWWDAKATVTVFADSPAGKMRSVCQPLSAQR